MIDRAAVLPEAQRKILGISGDRAADFRAPDPNGVEDRESAHLLIKGERQSSAEYG